MKKILFLCAIFLFSNIVANAQVETYANAWSSKKGNLTVAYFNNYPYSYTNDKGELTGIEIDLIKAFSDWLYNKKGIDLTIKYEAYDDFAKFYENVKNKKTTSIGAGSVTVSSERARDVKFSSPYLKNKPILISGVSRLSLTDVRSISKEFTGLTAVIVKNSNHEKLISQIKENYWTDLKIELVESPQVVIDKISSGEKYFGYVDLITYWASLQKDSKPLKMHRIPGSNSENFAFIFNKNSDWQSAFNEFFDSGLGFPSTDDYKEILRKHVGSDITNAVAIGY